MSPIQYIVKGGQCTGVQQPCNVDANSSVNYGNTTRSHLLGERAVALQSGTLLVKLSLSDGGGRIETVFVMSLYSAP